MAQTAKEATAESPKPTGDLIPYCRLILNRIVLTDRIINHFYRGSGTEYDPFLVDWLPSDLRNSMDWPHSTTWLCTMLVALVSSAYAGGLPDIRTVFGASPEVATLGMSMFVVEFALGPLLWAPLSEIHGRQIVFVLTYAGLTAFNAAVPGSRNVWTLVILRFFAGTVGPSPLTNAGGFNSLLLPPLILMFKGSNQ